MVLVLPAIWELYNKSGVDQLTGLALLLGAFLILQHGEGLRAVKKAVNDIQELTTNQSEVRHYTEGILDPIGYLLRSLGVCSG